MSFRVTANEADDNPKPSSILFFEKALLEAKFIH